MTYPFQLSRTLIIANLVTVFVDADRDGGFNVRFFRYNEDNGSAYKSLWLSGDKMQKLHQRLTHLGYFPHLEYESWGGDIRVMYE